MRLMHRSSILFKNRSEVMKLGQEVKRQTQFSTSLNSSDDWIKELQYDESIETRSKSLEIFKSKDLSSCLNDLFR